MSVNATTFYITNKKETMKERKKERERERERAMYKKQLVSVLEKIMKIHSNLFCMYVENNYALCVVRSSTCTKHKPDSRNYSHLAIFTWEKRPRRWGYKREINKASHIEDAY